MNQKRNNKRFTCGKKSWPKKGNNYKKNFNQQEQLKETEVGITQYVNKLNGFSGIIKARFSDFQVNEIALDGKIAKLTDTNCPDDFYAGII